MNGVHDMGGMQSFGKVGPEPNEPVFHAAWEGRALALNRAMGYLGLWTIDHGRYSRETMPPPLYLASSYYGKWTIGLEEMCVAYGLVGRDELEAGRALRPGEPVPRHLAAADVPNILARRSFDRPAPAPARFAVGDRVRTRNINPTNHTRLPRYARGRAGIIEAIRGCHVFPDSVTAGNGEDPHWLYTVVFEARELWGEEADPSLKVSIDAWDPYLTAA
jgi:nitrile hydratase beta subunit